MSYLSTSIFFQSLCQCYHSPICFNPPHSIPARLSSTNLYLFQSLSPCNHDVLAIYVLAICSSNKKPLSEEEEEEEEHVIIHLSVVYQRIRAEDGILQTVFELNDFWRVRKKFCNILQSILNRLKIINCFFFVNNIRTNGTMNEC